MALINAGNDVLETKRFLNIVFLREILIAARFGLVGLLSTTVHIAIVWFLLRETSITPILANTIAFLMAFGISFTGNYFWTFRSPGSPRRAMFRFFLIAVCAFAANTLLLAFLVKNSWFSPVISAVFSASVVPVISFAASRLWGFKEQRKSVL